MRSLLCAHLGGWVMVQLSVCGTVAVWPGHLGFHSRHAPAPVGLVTVLDRRLCSFVVRDMVLTRLSVAAALALRPWQACMDRALLFHSVILAGSSVALHRLVLPTAGCLRIVIAMLHEGTCCPC